jgi:lycopene cyclase domain-containing protein
VTYTVAGVIAVLAALAYDLLLARTRLVRRRAFWTAYAIMLGCQLIVNGVLTGVPVVRYDPRRITGVRLVYAPVEDLMFGFAMVLVTLTTWVLLGRRGAAATRAEALAVQPGRAAAAQPQRDR